MRSRISSTNAFGSINNQPWVKFQSAGWVNIQSAPTDFQSGPRLPLQAGSSPLPTRLNSGLAVTIHRLGGARPRGVAFSCADDRRLLGAWMDFQRRTCEIKVGTPCVCKGFEYANGNYISHPGWRKNIIFKCLAGFRARIVIPVVVGSSPIGHPTKYKGLQAINL